MPKFVLTTNTQRFEFDGSWITVFQYDDHGTPRIRSKAYEAIETLQGELTEGGVRTRHGTKAVDFVGLRKAKDGVVELYLIEVKDCRGHAIANKPRTVKGEFALEVALKARDTLAGLLGAYFTRSNALHPDLQNGIRNVRAVRVVGWLEADQPPNDEWKVWAKAQRDHLKRRLRWLDQRPIFANQYAAAESSRHSILGVSVSDLPLSKK